MYYVYVIQSLENQNLYTGFSANLKQRFKKHKQKGVHTTKRFGEIRLIFYEAYLSKSDARRRETYLKSTKGKRALKIMLKDTLAPSSSG